MKSKMKYIATATLLFGLGGFHSAKATGTDELLDRLQQFTEQVDQAFTRVSQGFSELDARTSANEARIDAVISADFDMKILALESRIATLETEPKATIAATAPTVFDDINAGFRAGSVWIDTTRVQASILVHGAPGAAVWKPITDQTFYEVGEQGPAGGIVFFVTASGMHGLEAAPEDQGTAPWGCVDRILEGTDEVAIGTGKQNTADILAGCPYAGIAARLANDYSLNGYSDWFLPSKDELNELHLNRDIVGGFSNIDYWSSSNVSQIPDNELRNYAWVQDFFYPHGGTQRKHIKSDPNIGVRAIRAF